MNTKTRSEPLLDSRGLFERWLELERASGRRLAQTLADLNATCKTRYRHNWPSVMAERGFTLDRCPTNVRRYMMRLVLQAELERRGLKLSSAEIDDLVVNLT